MLPVLVVAAALVGQAGAAQNATVSGRLILVEDGSAVEDAAEFEHAVVYFRPDNLDAVQAPAEALAMTTSRRQFQPRVLTITPGTEVIFPNEDPILHNVFSSSAGNRFDLGLYGRSDGKTHRFDQPGLVRVFCNVHPAMSAHILVVDTPHFVTPNDEGHFVIHDLPLGPGRLTLWHERAEARHIDLDLHGGELALEATELPLTIRQLGQQRDRIRRPTRRGRY
ncbi:MAG: hypothetical protein EA370_01660 [Wenzhouxiangella sp.]|nr:MAG: hypothetical protein EA370_01660 [Wenzhouxiangella sp.]